MGKLNPHAIPAIVVDFFLLGICVAHLTSVARRPSIPFAMFESDNHVYVGAILAAKEAGDLRKGDEILPWNFQPVLAAEYLEFAPDCGAIENPVGISFVRESSVSMTFIHLIPYYPTSRFAITTGFVGLAFWIIGLLILFSRLNEHAGRMLHWSTILMAATLMMTQGRIVSSDFFSLFSRVVLLLVYPLAGAVFLCFSTLFPKPKFGPSALKALVIITPAIVVSGIMTTLFVGASTTLLPDSFHRFHISYDSCHLLFALYGLGTNAVVVYSYVIAHTREERRKLQWIMWGFAIGPIPFIALIIIPQLLFSVDLVAEQYATLFLIVVPFSPAISFLKYQVLDIAILINRSIVYSVLTVFVGTIYLSSVLLLASAFGGANVFEEYFFVVLSSVMIAIILNPLRIRLQRFVDVTLFAAKAKFRESIMAISAELHKMISVAQLFAGIGNIVQRYLPVSTAALYDDADSTMKLEGVRPPDLMPEFQLSEEHAREIAQPKVYASPSAVSFRRTDIDTTKERLLSKLGIPVGLPPLSESGQLLGMLVVSPRTETRRFDEGEIDLISNIGHQAEEALERLKSQEKFIIEREGKRQAEGLNSLKSYFVSSVSHELRTPLTSSRMLRTSPKFESLPGPQRRVNTSILLSVKRTDLDGSSTTSLTSRRSNKGSKNFISRRSTSGMW